MLLSALATIIVVLIAFAVAAFGLSGAALRGDSVALAGIETQPFGGSLERVRVTTPAGKAIPVSLRGDRIVPRRKLDPGEPVAVEAVFRRPGWIGWLVGGEQTERMTLRTPRAQVDARWLTVAPGAAPRISFDHGVSNVAYGAPGALMRRSFAEPHRSIALVAAGQSAGSVAVAAAPLSWERLGKFQTVTWFRAGSPAVAATPAAGADVTPSTQLRLTFSKPVSALLGSSHPTLVPNVPGSWRQTDPHTLAFHPSGWGAPFNTTLTAKLPRTLAVVQADGSTENSSEVSWTVPPGATLRLHQLLAQAGYLPVKWRPKGPRVGATPQAQVHAALDPPSGHFSWRYRDTPASLRDLWSPGQANLVTEGALMSFEEDHGLQVDGVAGPQVWKALMNGAIAGSSRSEAGYSYVYVSETLPETVTLWHNGHQVLSGPANTGIPGAETELGTFPVFEHLEETTMSGENPDGSHYEDPGIKWVSYFNGGDALHAFDRASYGSPQSLGCVEMPLEVAEQVYPYTPIGTLVTVAQ